MVVFARETSDSLTSLVKAIDAATVKGSKDRMGSFVVFMSDEEESLKDKLKELAEKEGLKKCVLTIDNPTGPEAYKIAKEADVTVIFYNKRKVEVNRAFKKGELNEKVATAVVDDIKKALAKKDDKKDDDN